MAIFEIEGPDGAVYEIDAPDENTAISAFQQMLGGAQTAEADPMNPDGTYGQPPEGMVFNPETGQMEDLRSPINPNIPQGRTNAAMLGAGQGLGFNMLDEAVAGASTLVGGDYDYNVARMREAERRAAEDHPVAYYGGTIGGAIGTGAALGGVGLSSATNAARAGGSLHRVAIGSAIDGGVMGGLHGLGSGGGLSDRVASGTTGLVTGGVVGGAAPYALAGAQKLLSPFVRPIMSRIRPDEYASRALGDTVRRSGMTTDDIANSLARAQADDQAMFNVADAMGHSGQRALSTVARTPNDIRQEVVDTLTQRQMGQGERLARYLAEGFDAPDTAAQRVATLTAARDTASDAAFSAARQGAGPVDVSKAIGVIDDTLQPGATRMVNPGNNLANDTVEGALARARSLLTDGRSNLTDFNAVYRARQDIADWIDVAQRAGRGNQARLLRSVRNELDNALTAASSQYRNAMQGHQQASRVIDAVDAGRAATAGRTRATDNIAAFQNLTPDEQAAFRVGYADPLIARVENAAISPTTNKVRPLMTEKTGMEFPAFAAPGRADQLGNRLAREQRMFDTANAALGGSKTADNLADAAAMAEYDPGILGNIFNRPVKTALDIAGRMVGEAQGMSPGVTERVGRALLETNPEAARRLLEGGAKTAAQDDLRRAIAAMIMGNVGGATGSRLLPN